MKKSFWTTLTSISLFLSPFLVLAHGGVEESVELYHHSGMMGGGQFGITGFWITQILIWALLVAAIFALITWTQKK